MKMHEIIITISVIANMVAAIICTYQGDWHGAVTSLLCVIICILCVIMVGKNEL